MADIDLQQDIQRRQVFRPLLVQALRDFGALDGMHPGKVFSKCASFVGLDRADEMPNDVGIGYGCDFAKPFLKIVFAKVQLARVTRDAHAFRRLGFAGREQLHGAWLTPVLNLKARDALLDTDQIVSNVHGHSESVQIFTSVRFLVSHECSYYRPDDCQTHP